MAGKLEKKIIKKIYLIEAKKTIVYLFVRFFLLILNLFIVFIFALVIFEVLKEQNSFDLLSFFREDLAVIKKYLVSNLSDFYQELPQPLTYFLIMSTFFILVIIFIFVKNFKKIKNKVSSIYKFYKKL